MGRKSRAKKHFRAEVLAEQSRRPTRAESVKWGLEWGIGMAVVSSLFVVVQSLVRGSFYYERYDISAWVMVGAYAVSGVVAGILIGVLRNMAARRSGAILLGAMIGILVYGSAGFVMLGLDWAVAGAALVAGPIVGGLVAWRWSDPDGPLREMEETTRRAQAILRVSKRRNAT